MDLGGPKDVAGIVVQSRAAGNWGNQVVIEGKISTSLDMVNYTPADGGAVFDFSGSRNGNKAAVVFAQGSVKARYVRAYGGAKARAHMHAMLLTPPLRVCDLRWGGGLLNRRVKKRTSSHFARTPHRS